LSLDLKSEAGKKKSNNIEGTLDKSREEAEGKKKKKAKKKLKNKSGDESRSTNSSILNHLNSSKSNNGDDKKRSRNSSREVSSKNHSTLKITRMDLLRPVKIFLFLFYILFNKLIDEIKEESHLNTNSDNNINTESSKIEKK
jgi:hypothetical protein